MTLFYTIPGLHYHFEIRLFNIAASFILKLRKMAILDVVKCCNKPF